MADDIRPRVRVPDTVKKGEVFEVRTLITHPMESGQRKDSAGKLVPRRIIHTFVCTYNGREAIRMGLEAAMSANPFISFFLRATDSGTLEFTWQDDDGAVYKSSHTLTVG